MRSVYNPLFRWVVGIDVDDPVWDEEPQPVAERFERTAGVGTQR